MAYIKGQKCDLIRDWHVDSSWSYTSYLNRGSGSCSVDTLTYSISTSYTTTHKIEPTNNSDKIILLKEGNYLVRTKVYTQNTYARIPDTVISNASIDHWGYDNWNGAAINDANDPNKSKYICVARGNIQEASAANVTTEYTSYFQIPTSQNVYLSLMFVTWGYRTNHITTFNNIELYSIN